MKVLAVIAALLLPVASSAATRAQYLMGTVCEITAPDAQRIEAAFDEAARVESVISTWKEDSELSRLNRSGSSEVSPEVFALLETAMSWCERTDGAFDPLVGQLVKAWRTRADGAIPDDRTIAAAAAAARPSNVEFEPPSKIRLHGGAVFEEGAFGKGYAIDRMLAKLAASSAVVNFGGQIAVRDASSVAVADPEQRQHPVVAFTIRDASLSTSSGSEKTFAVGSRLFSHLIDPRTGQALPPRGSASALCDDALTADILSTALYVMGPADGLRWAEANRVAALFITPDHEIAMSSEFRRRTTALEILDSKFKLED